MSYDEALIDRLDKAIADVEGKPRRAPTPAELRKMNSQLASTAAGQNELLRSALARATATIRKMTERFAALARLVEKRSAPAPLKADPASGYLPRYTR